MYSFLQPPGPSGSIEHSHDGVLLRVSIETLLSPKVCLWFHCTDWRVTVSRQVSLGAHQGI